MAKKKKYERIDTTFIIDDDDEQSFESQDDNENEKQEELEMSIMWKSKQKRSADDSLDDNNVDEEKDDITHGLIESDNDDDDDDDEQKNGRVNVKPKKKSTSCRQYVMAYWLASIGSALMICFLYLYQKEEEEEVNENNESLWGNTISSMMFILPANSTFPSALLKSNGGVYSVATDFKNAKGNIPTYWQTLYNSFQTTHTNVTNDHKNHTHKLQKRRQVVSTSLRNMKEDDQHRKQKEIPHWGPCYAPIRHMKAPQIVWDKLMTKYSNSSNISYPPYHKKAYQNKNLTIGQELANLCRPGFLIIGAGKCGTSSLYQYLIGHPRVLPAKKKQIHYFKYFFNKPMQWYLSHFPNTRSFLASGSLMTGEASPGYMPYDNIPHRIVNSMNHIAINDENQNSILPTSIDDSNLPKIITIVRNPLSRAWSSYNYNYVEPAKEFLKQNNITGELFSFQELMDAELKNLKDCLKDNGRAHLGAIEKFKKRPWMKTAIQERDRKGIKAPILDLEDSCYRTSNDENLANKQPAQWNNLIEKNPDKVLMKLPNKHLIRSLIGRGLYVIPLDWWFALFPSDGIYIVCSEDLLEQPAQTMSDVGDFLGLTTFDFTDVVSQGLYNVGDSHDGYDSLSQWNDTAVQQKIQFNLDQIPLSKQTRDEFWDFVNPFTERMAKLSGKRCKGW